MSHIYYKDTIKVFPAPFHQLISTLFIESGKMPCSSNDKTKPCIILVNLAGIYFLRPNKLQKGYKISRFLSSFLITEVTYEADKRIIYTKNENVYVQCPHMDEAIVQLVSARKFLMSKYYDRTPVKFNNFPSPLNLEPIKVEGVRLLAIQYACYCAQHFERPDENGILLLFKKLNPIHHSILGLDAYCRAPNHLNCLCGPLHLLDSITTLFFSGFAPYSACRMIHKIMKHQMAIKSFILDSYKILIPEQLRLKKLSPKSLISVAIQNSRLSEDLMIKLFKELGEFGGEIQRLTLKNVELTKNSWNELLYSMTSCRSFKTIEVFELEKIDATNLNESLIQEGILKICKHCRFIQKFSVSLWNPALSFSNIKPFLVTTYLYKLSLQGQKLTEAFPDSFNLPNLLISLDFSQSTFSYTSLKSLFVLLSRTPNHTPITLNLSDIEMPSPVWNQFYQEMSRIDQPTYISELDWNGNPIGTNFISDFVSFFFKSSPIKFLSIDRIFGTKNMDDFKKFINLIPKGRLKGLSIGASSENNFCGGIPQLFETITTLCPINILHLIGQKIKVNDIHSIFTFLSQNTSSLWEIFIDDTEIVNPEDFFTFYKRLFALNIPIMGRPEIDLERLFGPKNTIDQNVRAQLENFKAIITKLPDVPSKICRSYFFSRRDTQKGLEFKDYSLVLQKFPNVFFDSSYIDRYQLQYRMLRTLPSLIPNMTRSRDIRSLSDLQATTLQDPYKEPKYEDPNVQGNQINLFGGQSSNQEPSSLNIQQQAYDQQYSGQNYQQQQYDGNREVQDQQYSGQNYQQQQYDGNQEVQDQQYQQYASQEQQYQQYGEQEQQYQQYGGQDQQYQQYQQYGSQDWQYQQYGGQDQLCQQYGSQNDQYQQYQQYGGQDQQYQQYGSQNDQYQQYGGQDQQYQQYAGQTDQYQQYGNITLDGQYAAYDPNQLNDNAMPNSSIDLMIAPSASSQQFFQPDQSLNQDGINPANTSGNQF